MKKENSLLVNESPTKKIAIEKKHSEPSYKNNFKTSRIPPKHKTITINLVPQTQAKHHISVSSVLNKGSKIAGASQSSGIFYKSCCNRQNCAS